MTNGNGIEKYVPLDWYGRSPRMIRDSKCEMSASTVTMPDIVFRTKKKTVEEKLKDIEYRVKWLNIRQWITAASVLLIGIILFILVRT
jgi:hypothetical protein